MSMNDPLRVYVVWHPKNKIGAKLGKLIFEWLMKSSDEVWHLGLGIPVFFKLEPWWDDNGSFRNWVTTESNNRILVPLVDCHMVAGTTTKVWKFTKNKDTKTPKTGQNTKTEQNKTWFIPVALDDSAFNMPELRSHNFLRAQEFSSESPLQVDLLRRNLTMALISKLRGILFKSTGPIKVFISHVKAQGGQIARLLHAAIVRQGQTDAFLDELSIQTADNDFVKTIEGECNSADAALAIITDSFSSSRWCSKELHLLTKPRKLANEKYVFYRIPVIAILATSSNSLSRLPDTTGGLSSISLAAEPDQDYWTLLIDGLFRELLLSTYLSFVAREKATSTSPGQSDPPFYVNWLPDIPSISVLLRQSGNSAGIVKYPGYGISSPEIKRVQESTSGKLEAW